MTFSKNLIKENEEVYYLKKGHLNFNDAFDFLINKSKNNKRKTSRICLHENKKSKIHKMLICHHKSFIILPHCHLSKDETCIVLKGRMNLLFHKKNGIIKKTFNLNSNNFNFIKIDKKLFHSMFVLSNYVIFLEITKGPFRKSDTIYPNWSNLKSN
tara:strand:- start:696 stop:1163 length:468 start_codon:yes stop_codon:yes gene_type:complete